MITCIWTTFRNFATLQREVRNERSGKLATEQLATELTKLSPSCSRTCKKHLINNKKGERISKVKESLRN